MNDKTKTQLEAAAKVDDAKPAPVEEQLDAMPGPVKGVIVGHQPKPYVQPDPRIPPYPGAHELAVAIGEHLGVSMQTAKHWLARYAADFIKEMQA